MKVGVLDVLRNPNHIRILGLLNDRGALRFNQIQQVLGLNPAQVDRALKLLYEGHWVMLQTIPGAPVTRRGIPIRYEVTPSGAALIDAFRAFAADFAVDDPELSSAVGASA